MRRLAYPLAFVTLVAVGCKKDEPPKPDPFQPVPECLPGTLLVSPLQGERAVVLSSLRIADFSDGFDLNLDGKIDNKLAPLGSLANPAIADTFKTDRSVIIPLELFGYSGKDSECAKLAFYLGRVNEDRDGDGRETTWVPGKSDCDDTNPEVRPGKPDIVGNRTDDDCDGYADNSAPGVPPTDEQDLDGDGESLKDGDCDDRAEAPAAKLRNRKAKDLCGDGIDQNCDGIPDNDPRCNAFTDNAVPVHLTALSFKGGSVDGGLPSSDGGIISPTGLMPFIVFPDGNVKGGVLKAGPDLFSLSLPFDSDISLTLTLNGARIELKLEERAAGTYVTSGKLGGVLDASTLAQIKGLDAGGVLKPEQSLLDAIFVGPVATILGLDTDAEQHYLPDIDVDRDGLETFWEENPVAGKPSVVNVCRDGDGTILRNNFDGKGTPCALAVDPKTGKLRFVDGLSVALKFTAVPVTLLDVTEK